MDISGQSQSITTMILLGEQSVEVDGPGSGAYNASLESYFAQQQSSLHPACIVSPQSVQGVSVAVKYLTEAGHNCLFAVRSGGHTSWAGASNIAGGIVIDLRALNTIELNANQSIVSVGVGASWDTVYEKLDPLGLGVNGGRAAGVGVGGLTLGGGISFFSPRNGWTCDTVSNFQVVLADGSIVDANTTVNPDLFFALKGGNNNFGIVTRVDLATFQQGLLWAATVYNNLSIVDDVIGEFVKINSVDTYDEYASFITTFGYSQARDLALISSQLVYTKEVENPPAYQGILNLPNLMNTSQITNATALAKVTAALQPDGARSLSLVTTLISTVPTIKAAYEQWSVSLPAIKNVPGLVWGLVLEPLPPVFYARNAKYNALGLADRSEPLVITLVSATWSSATDDALVTATANSLLDAVKKAAGQLDGLDPYIYLNYAGQYQNPIDSYGAQSVSRLQPCKGRSSRRFYIPSPWRV